MVVAQDPAAAGEGVLVEGAGLLVLAQRAQVAARLLAELRVSGWSSPRTRRRRVRVSSSRARACSCSPSAARSVARLLGRAEGVGVVVAEDPAAAGEGVLVEGAGLLVLTQRAQVDGEVVGRAEGVGVVVAEVAR